jgi:hypothetical protein
MQIEGEFVNNYYIYKHFNVENLKIKKWKEI